MRAINQPHAGVLASLWQQTSRALETMAATTTGMAITVAACRSPLIRLRMRTVRMMDVNQPARSHGPAPSRWRSLL